MNSFITFLAVSTNLGIPFSSPSAKVSIKNSTLLSDSPNSLNHSDIAFLTFNKSSFVVLRTLFNLPPSSNQFFIVFTKVFTFGTSLSIMSFVLICSFNQSLKETILSLMSAVKSKTVKPSSSNIALNTEKPTFKAPPTIVLIISNTANKPLKTLVNFSALFSFSRKSRIDFAASLSYP